MSGPQQLTHFFLLKPDEKVKMKKNVFREILIIDYHLKIGNMFATTSNIVNVFIYSWNINEKSNLFYS